MNPMIVDRIVRVVARAENLFAGEAPMPLVIPDELLHEAGLDEREALVEIACRLFEGGRLTLWSAVKFAGMSRTEFEDRATIATDCRLSSWTG